ncbi:PIG-L family deacetylase [Amycolatopsis thermalba]|uniref:PIG-L family deacetylase n=1 Tax=Amycolatopsis thermalba TaxID=944492 RepID=A0ABY4NR04_9PSEU|nr:PIG-L family deacetylase [Amycolatopsis thermalba]UQS22252.1 PIG-L family deacetylase [Amycolatopsis thermalba]
MTGLVPERLERIVVLGAHCDDIAIGAGGTLLTLSRPGLRVDALVLSGGGTEREDEERAALAAFCPGAHWDEVKNALEELRVRTEPDLIFGDGDLGAPSVYVSLRDELAEKKAGLLQRHYPSQRHRPWYDREARYAEAFHVRKLCLQLEG